MLSSFVKKLACSSYSQKLHINSVFKYMILLYNMIVHNKEKDGKHEKNKRIWKNQKDFEQICYTIYNI